MQVITVKTLSGESRIVVGAGACGTLARKDGRRFVVTDRKVYSLYKDFFETHFLGASVYVLNGGEKSKSFSSVQKIVEKMQQAGIRKTDTLYAVGGGVVGDTAGLVASLYMRGIAFINIPTTLLAQADSAIGGKTAVNVRKIKNAVGTIYPAKEIISDTDFLKTLSVAELKCGLGELIKYGYLDAEYFKKIETLMSEFSFSENLETLISDAIVLKKKVVEQDENDLSVRRSLNMGHTTAHAVEINQKLTHGECVLYGLFIETTLAKELGICEKADAEKLLSLVKKGIEFPKKRPLNLKKLRKEAYRTLFDKKNKSDGITLILPKKIGEWTEYTMPFEKYQAFLNDFSFGE